MTSWKSKVGALLLGSLMILLFFSKTIYASRLPNVTGEMPKRGALKNSYWATGVTQWGKEEDVYLPVTGKIKEFDLSNGDVVNKGDVLATMDYDDAEAHRGLSTIQNTRQKLALNRENLMLDIGRIKREIAGLEKPEQEEIKENYQLEMLQIEIKSASSRLKEMREDYNAGEATHSDLDAARYTLQKLYLQEEELKSELKIAEKKQNKTFEENKKDFEKEKLDKKDQLKALEIQLKQLELELSGVYLDEEPYANTLNEFSENNDIYAGESGVVTEVFAQTGESVQQGQKLLKLGISGEIILKSAVSLENDFIKVGDVVKLTNANHRTTGIITHMEVTDTEKNISIKIEDQDIGQGETFQIELEKNSETSYHLVPNGALNKDKDGYFINVVRQREGIIGDEYYLQRQNIQIGESDETHTAVLKGITFYEPVAIRSTKNVKSGNIVGLENSEEFYDEK